jgi:hypothetical protein
LLVSKRRASIFSTEGCRSRILSSSINPTFQVALLLGGYSTSASLRHPLFLHVASTYWKHTSVMSPLDLPLVSVSTFLEGAVVSPDPVQVEDSSGSYGALSSIQAPRSTLQRLDVRLRLRLGGFSSLDPYAPYVTSSPSRLLSASIDFISASSPTRRSGACETWVPMGPHRPGS